MNKSLYQVKVTNHNDISFEDRYDGILYRFKAGESVNVPYYSACHIFGIEFVADEGGQIPDRNEIMFKHLQRRWGWNRTDQLEIGRKLFDNLEFKVIAMSLVETVVADDDMAVLEEPRKKPVFRSPRRKEEEAV